jgi:hypothetical protein
MKKSAIYDSPIGKTLNYIPLLRINEIVPTAYLFDTVYHRYSVVLAHEKKLVLRTAQLIRESQDNLVVIMNSENGRIVFRN